MLEQRALPRANCLSFTMAGQPWHDFEWLAQLIYQIIYSQSGMTGLWLFKIALLLACAAVLIRIPGVGALPPFFRAAALALWSAGVLPYSDIRPELFSLLFFSILFCFLERQRLRRIRTSGQEAVGLFLLFALWSNLHCGFILGLALAGAYRAGWVLAAAAAASLCNPYGAGPYLAAWQHWVAGAELSRNIKEWHPLSFENPVYWPLWFTLGLCAALTAHFLACWKTCKEFPWSPLLSMMILAGGTLAHKRLAPYFNVLAVAAVSLMIVPWLKRPLMKKAAWAWLAAYACFPIWLLPRVPWTSSFSYHSVCRQAAEFLERERNTLGGLRFYNQWEWGGYLGWRLYPWYKVAQDGRY